MFSVLVNTNTENNFFHLLKSEKSFLSKIRGRFIIIQELKRRGLQGMNKRGNLLWSAGGRMLGYGVAGESKRDGAERKKGVGSEKQIVLSCSAQ